MTINALSVCFIVFFYVSLHEIFCSNITQKRNCDYFGNDLEENERVVNFKTDSFKGCEQKCIDNAKCTHFIWSKAYGCYLKHAETEVDVRDSFRPVTVVRCGMIKDRLKSK